MPQTIYIDGEAVTPDPSNWQLYAKQAIDSLLAKNPLTDNATQLATMNAVKEASGVTDSASPFHTVPGTVDASAIQYSAGWVADDVYNASNSVKQNTGIDLPATGSLMWKAAQAVVGGTWDAITGAGNKVLGTGDNSGSALDSLNADFRMAIVAVVVLGGLFLVIYGGKTLKEI